MWPFKRRFFLYGKISFKLQGDPNVFWTRCSGFLASLLIADDNAFVRQRVGDLFSRELDFEVCAVAENGRKAIQEAQDLRPDVILLDLAMPVMNGLEAARALKRLMPNVPIVIFSAYADSFTEKEARSAGVSVLVVAVGC